MNGVIFNSAVANDSRIDILGQSASTALGLYKPRSFDGSTFDDKERTIDYEKSYHEIEGGNIILDWTSDPDIWAAFKYGDGGINTKVWKGPITKQTERCVNQNGSVLWQFLSQENYTEYEIVTQCLNSSVFWMSNMAIDEAFEQVPIPPEKNVQECKKYEFSCDNGEQCVPDLHLWDKIFDCSDRSDEGPNHSIDLKVSIWKEIYIDEMEHALKIRVSITVSYDKDQERKMDENGKVLGYNVTIKPTIDTNVDRSSVTPCNANRTSCKVVREGFGFDREEEYEVVVIPVTRSTIKKNPSLQDVPVKITKIETMEFFKISYYYLERNYTYLLTIDSNLR